jgi:hypothetical protein
LTNPDYQIYFPQLPTHTLGDNTTMSAKFPKEFCRQLAIFCAASYAVDVDPLPIVEKTWQIPATFGDPESVSHNATTYVHASHDENGFWGEVVDNAHGRNNVVVIFEVDNQGNIKLETSGGGTPVVKETFSTTH